MDSVNEYIWQRRIHHGVRHQKSAVPFPDSVKIGLEFNAALERKEKLDLCLLTNGVMLELCEFAKTVTRSEMYFLFEMLDFNFDLGVDVDNDKQYYDYARRAHSKIKLLKDQIKLKPQRRRETFQLPDLSVIKASAGSEQSGRYYPKRNRTADISVLTGGGKKNPSAEHQSAESNPAAVTIKKRGVQLKLSDAYPFCKELGVTLVVRPDNAPREKLDPNLVTNGVMMELLDFSRVLCGTHTVIVHDLVKQNFGYELEKTFQVMRLMERKSTCLTAEDKDAFRNEVFQVQTKKREQRPKKRKYPDSYFQELEGLIVDGKRRDTLRDRDEDICQDGDLSYMCPVDSETETQSGSEAEPEDTKSESCSSETKLSVDVKEEEEEVFISPVQPQINIHNPFLFDVSPKNSTLRGVSDLFSEDRNDDMNGKTPKQKLWTRRAHRSKQILTSSRVTDMFARCREIGLDFNVGSGSKQNVDLQLFTNRVLMEVYKFAIAMTKSLRSFVLDILGNNFNIAFQDELHQRNFICYITMKDKVLQNHPDRWKTEFLSRPCQFPKAYNMVGVTGDFHIKQEVESEQQTNRDSPFSPFLPTSQQADTEPHPYCTKLGINLWSTEERPASQKLDLTVLTAGAVLEIFSLIRELCGSDREIVNDVLQHNFDLDLQSGATEASQVIQRWYTTQKSFVKRPFTSPKFNKWLNKNVLLLSHSPLDSQSPTPNSLEDLDSEVFETEMEAFSGDMEMEEKKVSSFHLCEAIGLDLDISCKSEAKRKLDLRLLTRGVLFELHQYVEQNCNRYVPALYEILEYNFDLSSQSHRRVEFAWSIASQVVAIAAKNGRKGGYLSRSIELPLEVSEPPQFVFKEETDFGFGELDFTDNNDIVFVQELMPVDIDVEVE